MLLSNQGFFAKLNDAIKQGPVKTATPDPVAAAEPSSGNSSGSQSESNSGLGSIVSALPELAVAFI
jgi:hypothetical protein